MKDKYFHSDLSDYLSLKMFDSALKIFRENKGNLDILYQKGIYFDFAIAADNSELLDVLLSDYYDQNNLNQPIESYNIDQIKAKYELLTVLHECFNIYTLSKEMEQVLTEYSINLTDDNSSVGDLEEDREVGIIEKVNNSQSTADHNNSPKQGDILKDIINNPSSGELLTSHNIQLLGQEGVIETKDQVVIEDIKEHQI